jgi:hypothetical protein
MSGRTTSNSQQRVIVPPLPDNVRRRPIRPGTPIPTIHEEDEQSRPTPDPRDRLDDELEDDDRDEGEGALDDEHPGTAQDEDAPNLANAIVLLANTLQQPREPSSVSSKVREPDQFDGQDPRKLRTFLMQLELNFNDRPSVFRQDRTKVNYALSYLKGTALEWFEPGLVGPGGRLQPSWLSDWSTFVDQLRVNFGPHDPTGEAEAELERLHMKENHRITKYNVDFARLAAQCEWGEAALRYQYYRGLPARIKDEISRIGKPVLLSGLRKLAQDIDGRYHERRSEISRENPKPSKPDSSKPASEQQQSKPSSSNPPTSGKSSDKKPDHSERAAAKSNTPRPSAPASRSPELQGKLGKDGKLTQEERQRRFDNKLCMFCGGAGHIAKDCNKKNAKARAATTKPTDPASVAESSDSKK